MGIPCRKEIPRYITGVCAMVLSLYFLTTQKVDLSIAVASVYFFFACGIDTFRSRIPNLLNASLAICGCGLNVTMNGWEGLWFSISGLILGIGLLLLPYLMGGFGAGDVKALGALGALTGPQALLHIFVYMALFGGGMAILHYISHHNIKQKIRDGLVSMQATVLTRDVREMKPEKVETLRFPYAAAIAFGYFSYLIWGGVL